MKLENIGFYTLSDYRVNQLSENSPMWRCELILTDKCNFNCLYCRGIKKEFRGDLPYKNAIQILDYWLKDGLKNVRFSGGEPTLYKNLLGLIKHVKASGAERIAISTNGSASLSYYAELVEAGVNDFSISLDSCCASTTSKITNRENIYDKLENNIRELAKVTYVTVGVVLIEENIGQLNGIIKYAYGLGVSDIRIITAAQWNKKLDNLDDIPKKILDKCPILNYRINNIKINRPIRGISKKDYGKCPLVIDDSAILKDKHYPCIIYLREQGKPIGTVGKNMRKERIDWFKNHNCFEDKICRNNCLDVCVDFANKYRELRVIK